MALPREAFQECTRGFCPLAHISAVVQRPGEVGLLFYTLIQVRTLLVLPALLLLSHVTEPETQESFHQGPDGNTIVLVSQVPQLCTAKSGSLQTPRARHVLLASSSDPHSKALKS